MKTFTTSKIEDLTDVVLYLKNKIKPPCLILLSGNLGFGKTTLVKKFFREFGIPENQVKSPTYSLINSFRTKELHLNHIDLYRLEAEDPFLLEEIKELTAIQNSITIVEWPDRMDLESIFKNKINISKIKIIMLKNNFRKIQILCPSST